MPSEPATPPEAGGRVVVGFDASERGRDAVVLGELLSRTLDAPLLAVRVVGASTAPSPALERERELDRLLAHSAVARSSRLVNDRSPAKRLAAIAREDGGARLIAVGSTHRAGLGRVLPGGVGEQLLGTAPCAAAIAPHGYAVAAGDAGLADGLRVIGVGYDGSAESEAALTLASEITTEAVATLRVITIGLDPQVIGAGSPMGTVAAPPDLQAELLKTVADLPASLRALPVFARGVPSSVLLEQAEQGVDLLILGSRGRGPLGAAVLGSTSRAVLVQAACRVVVVSHRAART